MWEWPFCLMATTVDKYIDDGPINLSQSTRTLFENDYEFIF